MAVVIDGGSASAVEIVAAALLDQHRALLIGTVSYGKGTAESVVLLPNGGELVLTWSRLVRLSGRVLEKGVVPVVCTSGLAGSDETTIDQVLIARRSGRRRVCPAERHG